MAFADTRSSGRIVNGEISMFIVSDRDIITARQQARAFADRAGFHPSDSIVMSTFISDVARSVLASSKRASITIQLINDGSRRGIAIFAAGEAKNGHNSSQSGAQLSSQLRIQSELSRLETKHVADEFEVFAGAPRGVSVKIIKWL